MNGASERHGDYLCDVPLGGLGPVSWTFDHSEAWQAT